MTPTQRTIDALRKTGYTAEVVEKWKAFYGDNPLLADLKQIVDFCNATMSRNDSAVISIRTAIERIVAGAKSCPTGAGVHNDLFGWMDVLAYNPLLKDTVGVQSTSSSNQASRVRKLLEETPENVRTWIEAGNRAEVHGWRKKKAVPGGKAMRWVCNVIPITIEMIVDASTF